MSGWYQNGWHDVAQLCLNGHVINSSFKKYPHNNASHCSDCGQKTITECPSCKAPIKGDYHYEAPIVGPPMLEPPAFCSSCGNAFPWTESALQAAREMADEFDELNVEDREKLKRSVDDLVREGPRTELAGVRFKKIMKGLGKDSVEGMKGILKDVLSDAIKKSLFGA